MSVGGFAPLCKPQNVGSFCSPCQDLVIARTTFYHMLAELGRDVASAITAAYPVANSMSLPHNNFTSLALRLAFAAALIGALRLPDQFQEALPTLPPPSAADADETSLAETEDHSQPVANIPRSLPGFNLGPPERASGKDAAETARYKCSSPLVSTCRELERHAGLGNCSRPVRLLFCVWVV